jgi:6-bladed beta-propeller
MKIKFLLIKFNFFLILLKFFLSGCGNSGTESASDSPPAYRPNLLDKSSYNPNLAEFISGYSLTPLQEIDTSQLLSGVGKLVALKDKWVVLDKVSSSVRAYDTTGNFICYYGKIGEGPGEYTDLASSDIQTLPDLGELWLYTNRKVSLFRYNLTNGNYKQAYHYEFFPAQFLAKSPEEIFFFQNSNPSPSIQNHNLVKADLSGKVSRKYSPFIDLGQSYSYTGFFSNGLFNPSFSDSVFQLVGDDLRLKYVFELADAANKAFPPGTLGKNSLGSKFYETENFCFFSASQNRKVTYYIFSKERGDIHKLANIEAKNFYWIQATRLVGVDASGKNVFFSADSEAVPALLAFFEREKVKAWGPALEIPNNCQVILKLYLK